MPKGSPKHHLPGEQFGRLTVLLELDERHGRGNVQFLCVCWCGKYLQVSGISLRCGGKISCGCGRGGRGDGAQTRKHEYPNEYQIWFGMRARCKYPKHAAYHNYGGRGITVCERWTKSFNAFLEDMGPRPSLKHSLERVNNDGNYEPTNVIWADAKTQGRNRRDSRRLTYDGETLPLAEWAERTGISLSALDGRVRAGWSEVQVLGVADPPSRARDGHLTTASARGGRSIEEAAAAAGISRQAIYSRLKSGWDLSQALTEPKAPGVVRGPNAKPRGRPPKPGSKIASIAVAASLRAEVSSLAHQLGLTLREVTERALTQLKPQLEREIADRENPRLF